MHGQNMHGQNMDLEHRSINTIRVLSADQVESANSGHPGMPMGMAPAAHVLWSHFLKQNPANAHWPNRDRFVLSNGHGCALLYSMLHLCGFNLPLDQLRQFRQFGSLTPGHPEVGHTDGVEATTGPLGQGISNGVGMAIAEKQLAATFNKPDATIVDNYTYVFCGDGCLQEGVASEACSLAGHLGLGKLIVIYDDNKIQIDGTTDLAFTENVLQRFEAYGWHTTSIEQGNDGIEEIKAAIRRAQQVTDKPSLIRLRTVIGFLSSKANTHGVHGAPLGAEDLASVKKSVGLDPSASFQIPDAVARYWQDVKEKGAKAEQTWKADFEVYKAKYPAEAAEFERRTSGRLPEGWKDCLPTYGPDSKVDATRNLSGAVLNALATAIPELVGGSADLTPSNKTQLKCSHDFQKDTPDGRYFRFGVREHGMISICNGIALYGAHIPFSATFLNFITYGFPAARLAALSKIGQLFVMTHDSIGLGEDGPTHQPVEVLTLLRACPNMYVFRPADGNEVVGAYAFAIETRTAPTVLSLTRQKTTVLSNSSVANTLKGAYTTVNCENPEVVYIATGSEVGIAVDAAKASSRRIRVVSAPCLDLFATQPVAYRREVLPLGVPVVSIEAAGPVGWATYAHHAVCMRSFGHSAPYERLYEEFGFTPSAINRSAEAFLAQTASLPPFGPLPVHLE